MMGLGALIGCVFLAFVLVVASLVGLWQRVEYEKKVSRSAIDELIRTRQKVEEQGTSIERLIRGEVAVDEDDYSMR